MFCFVFVKVLCDVKLSILYCVSKVRIMKKRLVRKAFDMILGISLSENREVCFRILVPLRLQFIFFQFPLKNNCYVLVMIFLTNENDIVYLYRTMRRFGRILANI